MKRQYLAYYRFSVLLILSLFDVGVMGLGRGDLHQPDWTFH
ncbi:hypothetical protein [Vibrio sp. B1FLJ16]|nr:hypothetical protein [Vibrio sp. B1FLJ16]